MDKYPSISFARPGQPTPPPPAATSGQQDRSNQVNELLSQFPNCRSVTPDRSVFDLPFVLPDGRTFILRVSLSPNFPQDRPSLSVSNQLVHPWVGYGGQLNFPSLQNWRFPSSRLAAVVHEAHGALGGRAPAPSTSSNAPVRPSHQQQPPPPQQAPLHPRPHAVSAAPVATPSTSSSPYSQAAGTRPDASVQPPSSNDIPTEFPSLQTMQSEELAAALTDPQAFQQLLHIIADELQISQSSTALRGSTVELAQRNLQKEAALSDIKNQIAVIRSAEYTSVMEDFQEKRVRVESLVSKLTPNVLMQNLATAAAEVDSESQAVVNQFMSGQLAVEDFVTQYGVLRTLYHKRDLKRKAAMHTMS